MQYERISGNIDLDHTLKRLDDVQNSYTVVNESGTVVEF